jgi:hypothetical protein
MVLPVLLIKALLLVPSVIFIFYGALYTVLAELGIRNELNKFYRTAGLTLLVIGISLLVVYSIV